jgi:lipopolysaccharide/colanic/teichoic acid biosynthesis glycosyltransferase
MSSGLLSAVRPPPSGLAVKRLFDLAAVLLTAPLWVPLLAILALLVRLKLGSPVFFRQKRPGRGEAIFELIKFRTMTDARDAAGQLLTVHSALRFALGSLPAHHPL